MRELAYIKMKCGNLASNIRENHKLFLKETDMKGGIVGIANIQYITLIYFLSEILIPISKLLHYI